MLPERAFAELFFYFNCQFRKYYRPRSKFTPTYSQALYLVCIIEIHSHGDGDSDITDSDITESDITNLL